MFYGTGANEVASGAHGDISTGCTDFSIVQDIHEVIFYVDANNESVGLALTYQPPAVLPVIAIQLG